MITTMPDKFIRVTSRFPNGRSTVYFDLERGYGFTLEQDQYRSEVSVLRMMGCYSDCAARYGDTAEAEADFADLTTMLGDRHCRLSLPASASLMATPSASVGSGRRRRLVVTGTVIGLVLSIVGASLASSWHWGETSRVSLAVSADPLSRLAESALAPGHPSATPSPAPMSALERMAWEQVRRQKQQEQQPPAPASGPSFGLQQ